MEIEVAIQSSILAWKILWTEEPGGLQSRGVRKRDNLVTKQQQWNKEMSLLKYLDAPSNEKFFS